MATSTRQPPTRKPAPNASAAKSPTSRSQPPRVARAWSAIGWSDQSVRPFVQRKCAACAAGRSPCPHCEEEERLQRQADPAARVSPAGIGAIPSAGSPLPARTAAYFGRSFSHDFSDVRVHTDSQANALARREGAIAYATGRNIVFAEGRYSPDSIDGSRLLAHELAHVVQQSGGTDAVQHFSGDDGALEREADRAADAATAGRRVEGLTALRGARPQYQHDDQDDTPAASVTVTLAGFVFQPASGATYHKGPKYPQLLAMVLKALLGAQYTPAFRDQVMAAWGNTPLFNQDPSRGPGRYTAAELRGPDASEGEPFEKVTWQPLGVRGLLEICARLGKPITLPADKQRLLEFGAAARQAYPYMTDFPRWFTQELFVAVMVNRATLLEHLVKASKDDALPPDQNPMAGALAQLAIKDIRDSLATSVWAVDFIRQDSALVHHDGYRALWPSRKLKGSPGADDIAPETRVPKLLPAAVLITYADARHALAETALLTTEARKELLDGFVMALKYRSSESDIGPGGVQQLAEEPANVYTAPPYPSTLTVYPALENGLYGSTRADYGFVMGLEFPDLGSAFQWHTFEFDKFRVPDDKLEHAGAALSGTGEKPSHWALLKKRLAQDEKYHEADVQAYANDLWDLLGPPGLVIRGLIELNAAMRVLGTLISSLFETAGDPSYVARFNFAEEGLYIVRCIAEWHPTGDVALRRPPSVAYVPIFVRSADLLAEQSLLSQLDEEAEARKQLDVVNRKLAPGNTLSATQRKDLEDEKKRLEAATGGVEAMLKYQEEVLAASKNPEDSGRLKDIRTILERRQKRHFDATTTRLPGVFVNDAGQVINLLLEVRTVSQDPQTGKGTWEVNDATTPSSVSESASGERKAAILAALQALFKREDYGRGRASVFVDGVLEPIDIPTVSAGKLFMEAASNAATVLSLIAVIAAPLTGGESLILMVPAMIIGAVPSAYNIIRRDLDDTLHCDLALAMDIVNVVGALVGIGAETRAGMQAIRLGTSAGRVIIVTGLLAMGGGVLLMPLKLAQEIDSLKDMPEALRGPELMKILGGFMLSVGIMVGGVLASQARARGEFTARTFDDWLGDIDKDTRERLEATKGETDPARNFWKIYSEMDPLVRDLLTQCGSDCVPMDPPPSKADQARIRSLADRLSADARRRLKGLLHENRTPKAMKALLGELETARAKVAPSRQTQAIEGALLRRATAADYILSEFSEAKVEGLDPKNPGKWSRTRQLANEVAAAGKIPLETLGKILDNERATEGGDPEQMLMLLKELSDIADRAQGVDKILGLEGLSGHRNFFKGSRWTLRFLHENGLWDRVKGFEEPAPGTIIDRIIDVRLTDGTRIEMKSWAAWHNFADVTFTRQIMGDFIATSGFRTEPVLWAFEPGEGIGSKDQLIARMEAALDKALQEKRSPGYDDPAAGSRVRAIKARLPQVVTVK